MYISGSRSPPGLPTGPQDPLSAFEMTRLALLKVRLSTKYFLKFTQIFSSQMYNQSTGGGPEHPRPPLSLPNIPLPPELPGLHGPGPDKALNLHRGGGGPGNMARLSEELRRREEESLAKLDMAEEERHVRREMELKRDRLGTGDTPPLLLFQ